MPITSKTTATRQRLDPAVRREQIAGAAATVFAERDPGDVSFDEIANAAGVSRSLVYKYFGDRSSLLAAAYLHDLGALDDCLRDATADCVDDKERLRAVIATYLDFARANLARSRLIASLGTLRHPAVQAAMNDRIERIAGQFGDTQAAQVVARGVVGLLESASIYWVDQTSHDVAEVTDLLFKVLWGGLNEIADDLGLSRTA